MSHGPSQSLVRIVHLEDDPLDRDLVHSTLDESAVPFSIVHAGTRDEFLGALTGGPVDLILSDFTLPNFNGAAALEIARRVVPDVPFVFVTGSMGEEAAIDTLRGGATDYVLKHRLSRLVPAVQRALQETVEKRTRREAEIALARERGFLLALLDSLEAGVVACDARGEVTLVNRAMREMHGLSSAEYSVDEWLSRPRLFASDGKTPLTPGEFPLNRALGGEALRNEEISIQRSPGDARAVLAGGQPILDGEGNKLGAVVALHDVTEHKQLERQFRQSQKMEAMGVLAAGVAHDFNNILTVIMGFGQILEHRLAEGSRERSDVREVLLAAERAAGLTRQLLAFTRQQAMSPRVLDLNDVVHDLDKMLRRVIGEDIDLCTVAAPDLGRVLADSNQIEQVLMNLAVNARDAMERGGRLTIQTRNVELDGGAAGPGANVRGGRYVRLSVSDTGCGMPPEMVGRIFEPFFTTKEVGRGTGLGLSTVHGIVQQSGGHIEVESAPGRGTTFHIYLARVEAASAVAPAAASPRATATGAEGTETLLVVEDEASIRRMLCESLRRRGYTVLEASHGREALELAAAWEGQIDLLLTDVVMPVMNGPELAARLGTKRPDVPILFISGYADASFALQGVIVDGAGFLQKPFSPDAVARRIRELLDVRGRNAA